MNKTKTLQDFFSMAFIGLRNQEFKRSTIGGLCKYRGPNGLKCAIGHCISDKKYTPEMEGLPAHQFKILDTIGAGVELEEELGTLQMVHDCSESPGMMEIKLREFAKDHGLEVPA